MLKRWKKTETEALPATHGSTVLPAAAPETGSRRGPAAPADRPVGRTTEQRPQERRDRSQGKNAPTPRRKDQEAARRRTLVPEDRKAARRAEREAAAQERMRQRHALETGDERNLPARDRGPQKRWVRDYVDARTGLGEWLMPVVLLYVVAMFIPGAQFQLVLMISLYVIVALVIAESFLVSRRIKKGLTAAFGAPEPGTGFYGVMRALQFRRLRLPKPQVKRGQFPA
ncbi:DUF3043 domain-containing protein [Micrococcus sp.]|uniref:DUF3043 domain-containing protein n=1 Tax=Micrococcus sp. TaxID=1271 RepID=UPI0026DD133A|nr:DUF3043 domain-containing protein [Micrococcus sp.]MDO4238658.1 DUF3043 domain-containing protein [Micrococcus sp.]